LLFATSFVASDQQREIQDGNGSPKNPPGKKGLQDPHFGLPAIFRSRSTAPPATTCHGMSTGEPFSAPVAH
jgi:hypothetical protein